MQNVALACICISHEPSSHLIRNARRHMNVGIVSQLSQYEILELSDFRSLPYLSRINLRHISTIAIAINREAGNADPIPSGIIATKNITPPPTPIVRKRLPPHNNAATPN